MHARTSMQDTFGCWLLSRKVRPHFRFSKQPPWPQAFEDPAYTFMNTVWIVYHRTVCIVWQVCDIFYFIHLDWMPRLPYCTDNGIAITIRRVNPENPLRNVRIIMPGSDT